VELGLQKRSRCASIDRWCCSPSSPVPGLCADAVLCVLQRQAIRRNLRLRKEYLYARSLEGKEREAYDRKQRIKSALEGARPRGCFDGDPARSSLNVCLANLVRGWLRVTRCRGQGDPHRAAEAGAVHST
jgi:hypothetical protein